MSSRITDNKTEMNGLGSYTNDQLLKAIRNGEEKAFEQLFVAYYAPLCRFVWRYIYSEVMSEELVQEVFIQVWENRKRLITGGSLRAYLYRAAKNKMLDHVKHQRVVRRHREEMMAAMNEEDFMVHNGSDESGQDVSDEFMSQVRRAVEELPKRARQVYELHQRDGLTYQEIAMVMEISPKTVESQMSRALKFLRDRLAEFLPLLIMVYMLGLLLH